MTSEAENIAALQEENERLRQRIAELEERKHTSVDMQRSDELRHLAERMLEHLQSEAGADAAIPRLQQELANTDYDLPRLIYKMQVYQTELEIQSEHMAQTQHALTTSHQRYRDLFDFAPIGYFMLTSTGVIDDVNVAGTVLLGIERAALIQRPFRSFVFSADQARYDAHQAHLFATTKPQRTDLRLRYTDDTIWNAHIESSLLGERGPSGEMLIRMAVVDITEQVRAEQALQQAQRDLEWRVEERTARLAQLNESLEREVAERQRTEQTLRESEALFRLVLSDSPVVVFQQDSDLRYTWVHNPLQGLSVQALLGKTHADLWPPDEAAHLDSIKRKALAQGITVREEVRSTLQGQTRWYDLKVAPLYDPDGTIVGLLGAASDITDYRRAIDAERLLADASVELASSLDVQSRLHNLAHLLVPTLADLCILHILSPTATPRHLIITHRDPEREAAVAAWLPADLTPTSSETTHPLIAILQTGETLCLGELRDDLPQICFTPDSAYAAAMQRLDIISFLGVPLTTRGTVVGSLVLATMESQRAYGAQELRLAEDLAERAALAAENARLYEEEQQARAEAEAALRMRDHVLSVVSHDLNNPLTVIQGDVQMLHYMLESANLPRGERIMRGLQRISMAVRQIVVQTRELVDVASLQTGRALTLQRSTCDLVTLTRQSVEFCQQIGNRHQVDVMTALEHLVIEADSDRMERVLSNLITNAIKYSPAGSRVQVRVEQEEAAGKGWAVVAVEDQGVGIPETELTHVFEPFRRGSNVQGQVSGTGLGLASARHIIEQHGGAITVQSRVGHGTTFTIWLPQA
jgi:PAS domain S-box-containing protein